MVTRPTNVSHRFTVILTDRVEWMEDLLTKEQMFNILEHALDEYFKHSAIEFEIKGE